MVHKEASKKTWLKCSLPQWLKDQLASSMLATSPLVSSLHLSLIATILMLPSKPAQIDLALGACILLVLSQLTNSLLVSSQLSSQVTHISQFTA